MIQWCRLYIRKLKFLANNARTILKIWPILLDYGAIVIKKYIPYSESSNIPPLRNIYIYFVNN